MKFYNLLFLLFVNTFFGQDTIQKNTIKVDISGYIDAFYSYDFDTPVTGKKQTFFYNYNRHNEFNVNLALLRASIAYENVYARLSFQAGTYVEDNYAAEDTKFINEAYIGLYLDKDQKTTIEAGILPSYIGFETATSHSNLTATRSLLAENSPYFMTGVKLNHQFNDKLSGAFLVTNGWQRIKKINNKIYPSIGTQLIYKPSENSVFNWSTFVGKEVVGSDFAMRYFSNLYWDKNWNPKWKTIAGFDLGVQNFSSTTDAYANWLSPVLITQYKVNDKWNLAHRIEYYQDAKNVIIASTIPFKTFGNSINFDFLANSKTKLRTEAKWLHASENIFDSNTKKDNFSLTSTISFEF